MYRARANNLQLQDKEKHRGKSTKCIICDEKLEDLNHFMLWCPAYNEERGEEKNFQRPYVKNEGMLLVELLFKQGIKKKTIGTIDNFWRKTEKKKKGSNLLE